MVVNGVSTRKVTKVMETLCGLSFSKSEVHRIITIFKKGSKDMFSLIFDLLIKWPLGILFALIF